MCSWVSPTPEPPGVGLKKNNFIDCLDSSWHFPDFWFFDALKFPLRPPPLGGKSIFLGRNHPQICRDLCILNPFSDLFFAFKDTISRHFAGYTSVALETIWLHEPRDLIFLGPLMTLLCLSSMAMGEVLFTHADRRRMWYSWVLMYGWGVVYTRWYSWGLLGYLSQRTSRLSERSCLAAWENAANESRWRKQAR